jgi:hypothetical protein
LPQWDQQGGFTERATDLEMGHLRHLSLIDRYEIKQLADFPIPRFALKFCKEPMTKITLSCLTLLLLSAPGHAQDNSRAGTSSSKFSLARSHQAKRRFCAGRSKGATKVTIAEASESGIGRPELRKIGSFDGSSGTLEVKPKENTNYVITCEGSTTYTCASISVRVRVRSRQR